MALAWRSGVHAVAVEDDLVLLDETADAYVCLLGGGRVVSRGRGGDLVFTPPQAADDLLAGGLLEDRDLDGARETASAMPDRRLARPPVVHVRPFETLVFMTLAWRVSRAVRHWPMGRLLSALRADRATATPRDDGRTLAQACAVFDRLIVWGPFGGACLFRSVLRRRFLMALGHDADLVIGVRTWPFRAHCWLQVGSTALDDWPERLRAYRPILSV